MSSSRYDLAVQRRAAEQVLLHHRPVAQIARQLKCSPQSVKNWIDRHRSTITASSSPLSRTTFLPLQTEEAAFVTDRIESVTKNGFCDRS